MFSEHKKKILAGLMVTALVSFGAMSFSSAPSSALPPKEGHHNLKVLPKDISHEELMKIMHDFCNALHYRCGDCHAAAAGGGHDMDFASDANPKKNVARHMMKMMARINKKNFEVKGAFAANYVNAKYPVTCYTCHHGSEHPATYPDLGAGRSGRPGVQRPGGTPPAH